MLFLVVLTDKDLSALHIVNKIDEQIDMFFHYLSGKTDNVSRIGSTVCSYVDSQLLIVDTLTDSGALYLVISVGNGREYRIYRYVSDSLSLVLVVLRADVTSTVTDSDLHIE